MVSHLPKRPRHAADEALWTAVRPLIRPPWRPGSQRGPEGHRSVAAGPVPKGSIAEPLSSTKIHKIQKVYGIYDGIFWEHVGTLPTNGLHLVVALPGIVGWSPLLNTELAFQVFIGFAAGSMWVRLSFPH